MNKPAKLIPLGTRISHWNGHGHGFGTIVAYNGIPENSYLRQNFGEAVDLVVKSGCNMLGGLVNSMYDGGRYPYVVQFDPRVKKESDSEIEETIRTKYPRGYRDVYTGGDDSTELTLVDQPNAFPNDLCRFVMREWLHDVSEWSDWAIITEEQRDANIGNPDYQIISR